MKATAPVSIPTWRSRLASGIVHHRRRRPTIHDFTYRVGLLLLDLDEAPRLLQQGWWSAWRRPGLVRFHRPDFLAGVADLRQAVRDLVAKRIGIRVEGRIELLTTLRTGGIGFNPASFYLCRNHRGHLQALVAEITNTPWGERYQYVLVPGAIQGQPQSPPMIQEFIFAKAFHISPFHRMGQMYRWSFTITEQRIAISMANLEAGEEIFTAHLALRLTPATPGRMFRFHLRWPLQAAHSLFAIYWQAFRLWLKGVPVVDHPGHTAQRAASSAPSSPQPESRPVENP